MSMVLESVEELIEETEFESLDLSIDPEDEYLVEMTEEEFAEYDPLTELSAAEIAAKAGGYATAASAKGEAFRQSARGTISHAGQRLTKYAGKVSQGGTGEFRRITTKAVGKAGKFITANPQTSAGIGLAAVVIAAAGATAIIAYMNSIGRLNRVVEAYKKKVAALDGPAKAKAQAKLANYTKKLEVAKSKAREKKKGFIEQTKSMSASLPALKKSNPSAAAALQKKLDARSKVMAKIGAV